MYTRGKRSTRSTRQAELQLVRTRSGCQVSISEVHVVRSRAIATMRIGCNLQRQTCPTLGAAADLRESVQGVKRRNQDRQNRSSDHNGEEENQEPRVVRPTTLIPSQLEQTIQAPGHTQVDFEERVEFSPTARLRCCGACALAASGLAAAVVRPDNSATRQHRDRQWARDKAHALLLLPHREPYIWDFGSAAKHIALYALLAAQDHMPADCSASRPWHGPRPVP